MFQPDDGGGSASFVPVETRNVSEYTAVRDVDPERLLLKLFVPKIKAPTEAETASKETKLKELRRKAKEAKARGEKFVPPADDKERQRGPIVFIDYLHPNGRRGPLKLTFDDYLFVPFDPCNEYEALLFDPEQHCTIVVQVDPAKHSRDIAVLQAIQQKIVAFFSKHSKVLLGEEKDEADTANLMYPLLATSKMGTDENPLFNLKLHVYPTRAIWDKGKKVGEVPSIEVLNVTGEHEDGSLDVQSGDMTTIPKKSELSAHSNPSSKTSLEDLLRQSGLQVRRNTAEVVLPKVGDDDEEANHSDSGTPHKRARVCRENDDDDDHVHAADTSSFDKFSSAAIVCASLRSK